MRRNVAFAVASLALGIALLLVVGLTIGPAPQESLPSIAELGEQDMVVEVGQGSTCTGVNCGSATFCSVPAAPAACTPAPGCCVANYVGNICPGSIEVTNLGGAGINKLTGATCPFGFSSSCVCVFGTCFTAVPVPWNCGTYSNATICFQLRRPHSDVRLG
jgi:hypothetical protein